MLAPDGNLDGGPGHLVADARLAVLSEIEFLLLRSLPVAPFRLLFYASFSACFDGIQFSVFDLDYASSSSIVPNEDGQPPCAVLEDALASSCSGWQIG